MPAVDADLGAVFDRSAERLYLIDETGREVRLDQALLLYLRLIGANGDRGTVAVPVTVTSQVEELVGDRLEVVRPPASVSPASDAGVRIGGHEARHCDVCDLDVHDP